MLLEVTENEKAMVLTFRLIEEIPPNVILWYCSGLECSANKLLELTDNSEALLIAKHSISKAKSANRLFFKYLTMGE